MQCPICQNEMSDYGEPQVSAQDIKETGQEFPVKLVCMVFKIWECKKCNVKVSKANIKDYFPVASPPPEEKICEEDGYPLDGNYN